MRVAALLMSLFAFSFTTSPALASDGCEGDLSSASRSDGLANLKSALFFIGAHVLQTVDRSEPYPRTDADRAHLVVKASKTVEKKAKKFDTDRLAMLAELRETGVDDVDLFHGSHVVVKDGGARYERWQNLGARARTSSHYPGVTTPQYEIDFPGMGVVLFGKDADGSTWFQTEAHADSSGLDWALHRLDYVKHKGLGFVNVGPLGLSPRSDKRGTPIIVQP